MEIILRYFPELTQQQQQQFEQLKDLYTEWNAKINVISRKDIDFFYEHHVLHSLAIAKYIQFLPYAKVMDLGTGGGFPAIPLAIFFPQTEFWAVDSIGKKIKVVEAIHESLGLKNVRPLHARAETLSETFDFIVTRAVAPISELYEWTKNKFRKISQHKIYNGILALKGGDLKEEFACFKHHYRFIEIASYFREEYFQTKKIVYVPMRLQK
ncbi:MAG: 16S rRNA (guanine(527)-N(7))-methyltransferase RsmG [Cytophagales bacterium]|nr:16S rRNA (guanine(527)-N(7))-methyltransferase RsmG [Cytophagales bacterium]MDW8384208.1 16S rRNA (guanine(527)-N(7))-methyltransferase RsmG [Flammeovirgaceae bacterium]